MPRTPPIRFCEIRKVDRDYRVRPCPLCRKTSKRRTFSRHRLWDLGGPRPVLLDVRYSMHFCKRCRKYFSASCSDCAYCSAPQLPCPDDAGSCGQTRRLGPP